MSNTAPSRSQLSDFIPLSSSVSLYTPPATTKAIESPPNAPTLVIMCVWAGGATAARISKYTTPYQKLLPTAPILLIQTQPSRIALLPFPIPTGHLFTEAVSTVRSHLASLPEGQARVHIHIFSNGGCDSALNMIHKFHTEGIRLPFTSVVLDSCPSNLDFWASWRALRVSLPTATIPRIILTAPIMACLGQVVVMHKLGVLKDGNQMSRELNEKETFGSARRVYLLGKGDEVVDWRESWGHAEDAKNAGVDVRFALFEGSHCALVMGNGGKNERRYWRAITALWEDQERVSKL